MATYKEIRGVNIQSLESDPTAVEGDVWYNASTSKLKMYAAVNAWSAGGDLNSVRASCMGSGGGTQTAALCVGGYAPPPTLYMDDHEQYDGTSWTELADLNQARQISGDGTQTAAFYTGGALTGERTANCESWNGSAWTETANLNTIKMEHGYAGTTTAALTFGGKSPEAQKNQSEEWDGSSWTEGDNLNTARYAFSSGGVQTAAIGAGGYKASALSNNVETYNGSSWSETTDHNTARYGVGGSNMSSTTDGLVVGGYVSDNSALTESWNGTSWTEVADLNTASNASAGAGTASSALHMAGGQDPNRTEEWSGVASVETIAFD